MQKFEKILNLVNQRKPLIGDTLCALFGMLVPLAFAPFEWRPMVVLSLAGFLLLLHEVPVQRVALRAFIYCIALFSVGISWVYNSLHDFGSASFLVSALITAALVLACSAVVAGALWLYARGRRASLAFNYMLLFPAAWVLGEWVRSWLFTGFPWLLLGYSQIDTVLSGYAPLVGAYGVTFGVAVIAGAVVTLALGSPRRRIAAAAIIALMLVAGMLLNRLQWVVPAGDTLKAALIQGNIPQELKLKPESLAFNVAHYQDMSRAHYDSDLIVWPETAIPTFKHRMEQALHPYYLQLQEHGVELVTGIFVYDPARELYYNSLYKLGTDEIYSKQHLVPFGEYMPLRGLLEFMGQFINIPMSDLAPARNIGLMSVGGIRRACPFVMNPPTRRFSGRSCRKRNFS
jgi:apolipoprotein N-acyltransferase